MRDRCVLMFAAVALIALPGFANSAVAAQEEPRLQVGRELLGLFLAEKFDEFCARGDEMMLEGFRPPRARITHQTLQNRLGGFQTSEGETLAIEGPNAVITFRWRFDRGTVVGRVIVDPANRLAGLWFDRMEMHVPPPAYADSSRFAESALTVGGPPLPLPGKICIPNSPGPHPAVVLLHGSGPQDMEQSVGGVQMFRDLAWGLASRGIVVLRYDKRTRAHPMAVKPEDWTPQNEVIDDARAALALLRGRSEVDAQRIIVVGHSLGAMLTPLVVKEEPAVAGAVMIAVPGRSVLDLLEEQTAYIAESDGDVSEEERRQRETIRDACEKIRSGAPEQVSGLLLGQPAVYWARLHAVRPLEVAATWERPMLVLHAERDYQVTRPDAAAWREFAKAHPRVTSRELSGLNHLLVRGTGKSVPEEYRTTANVDESAVAAIADWILEKRGAATSAPASAPATTSEPAPTPASAPAAP
ncbi:MAG: alpha/beta fold hydrolase [Phycisphaerales bacterium]|nr:alpha/beta fold hydrolase [Phycisphaerales bacterium]